MLVKATLPGYKQVEKDVSETKTIRKLKKEICAELGIETELTRLLLDGKRLHEESSLRRLKRLDEPLIVDYLWARHLVLWGSEGQKKIRSATVLLAGAGAIGNEVAKNLAMLGVGRLIVVDRDVVELSNVSRMIFFDRSSLGKNKAEVLARNVHRRYPFVEVYAFRGDLEKMPLKFYLDSEVIVSGLDNVVSRIFLTQLSRKYSIPLIDGGIMGLTARVQSYVSPEAACPICIFPQNQYSNIVGLRNPCDAPLEQQTVPSFSTSISLTSSILAQEAIKIILGFENYKHQKKWPEKSGEPLSSVLFMDLKNNRFTSMPLKKNEACFVCGKEGTARSIVTRFGVSPKGIRRVDDLEDAVRKTLKLGGNKLTLFLETANGERRLREQNRISLRHGEFVRVIVQDSKDDLSEAICRLT